MRKGILLLIILCIYNLAGTAQIVAWNFTGNAGTETTVAATTKDVNLAATSISRGPGLLTSALANAFSSTDYTASGTFANAVANGDYQGFTIQANSGYLVSLSTLDVSFRRSGTGPNTFQWQYSLDGFATAGINIGGAISYTLTTGNGDAQTQINLSAISALQNVPSTTTITFRLYGYGATQTTGTFAIGRPLTGDDLAIGGTVSSATNSVAVAAVNTSPFNLADCSATASGTVDFTSTGTFNPGNIYTVQLSDALGSFASPVTIGSSASIANSGTINITIPAGTASGVLYKVRVNASDPVITGSASSDFTIVQGGLCTSSPTDFFRSKASGNWNDVNTWESSATGLPLTWLNATLTPTANANTIEIRNGHHVNVTASTTADQVVIENGGILEHSAGTFTIQDGAGDDVDIQSGGILLYATAATSATFASSTANVNIATGGILRISATGLTGTAAGNIHASNYVYNHQSILEYTITAAFSSSNITFFPNATASIIPIFRTTNAGVISVGAASPNSTTINGVLDCQGAGLTWQGSATKIFRNGIMGSGPIDGQNGATPSGKFIINGATAEIGGTGTLTLSTANGLEIGSATGTVATVTSNKTITGDINLISTSTRVDLGNNTLTVNGSITNGGQDAFVRTNGTGALTFPAVATSKEFPIGNTRYSPLRINSGAGGKDFTARVEEGINNPSGAVPTEAVNKTWYLNTTSVAATNVIVEFQYAAADCNPAVLSASTVELLQSDNTTWSLVLPAPPNNVITPAGADPAITATALAGMAIPTNPTPYTVGVTNTIILPVDCIVSCQSRKVNNNGLISWEASSCAQVASFEIQRSTNNGAYVTIGRVTPVTNQLSYQFTDAQLAGGTNLYRIKINGTNGAVKYSNIVAILNSIRGILFTAITPNPVNDKGTLVINAARAGAVNFVLYDLSGKPVRRFTRSIVEGSNTITIEAGDLPAGLYHLAATSGDDRTVLKFIKQ